MTTVLN